MKIWELAPKDGAGVYQGYDSTQHVIVRAKSEARARELVAAGVYGAEGKEVWLDPEKTVCIPVPVRGKEGILCHYFLSS